MNRSRQLRRDRAGATVVEFAIVGSLMITVIFASIEIGRALMATQSLDEAARSACRVAVLRGVTTAEIEAEVERRLAPAGISTYSVQVLPADRATSARWSPVSVTLTASFQDVSWLPLPRYFGNQTYTASCTLPKEYSPSG